MDITLGPSFFCALLKCFTATETVNPLMIRRDGLLQTKFWPQSALTSAGIEFIHLLEIKTGREEAHALCALKSLPLEARSPLPILIDWVHQPIMSRVHTYL